MPLKNDPAHRHSKPAPRAQRKSKPKFEIPAETGLPAAPVEWVYRTDEVPPQPPPAAAPPKTVDRSKATPFEVAGMGLFFVGAATVGLVSLVALGVIAIPMGMMQRLRAAI